MDELVPEATSIRAWKPPVPGVREVLYATFAEHAYPLHTHDVWTLFVVDQGAVRYDLDRRANAALPSMVSVLPPHVVHDGRPATGDGYTKRVIYLETSVLASTSSGLRSIGRSCATHRSEAGSPRLHAALECVDDALEAEVRLADVADRIRASMGDRAPAAVDERRDRDLAEQLRAYLDERLFETPDHGRRCGAPRCQPDASWPEPSRRSFAIPPHAYVDGRRLEAARDRILAGQPLADVAAEVGYVDQAHLSRRFKRFLGTTPGRFAGRR